jgi:hypothetical protein
MRAKRPRTTASNGRSSAAASAPAASIGAAMPVRISASKSACFDGK